MFQQVHELVGEAEIESLFKWIIDALRVTVVLDSVHLFPDNGGCLIRSHDSYGRLPDIDVAISNDRDQALDRVSLNIARLARIARFRWEIATLQPHCVFMAPIFKKKSFFVAIDSGGEAIRAEGPDLCRAYQQLSRIVADLSIQAA